MPWSDTRKGRYVALLWAVFVLGACLAVPAGQERLRGIAPQVPGSPSDHAARLVAQRMPGLGSEQMLLAFDSSSLRADDKPYRRAVTATLRAVGKASGVGAALPLPRTRGTAPRHVHALVGTEGDAETRRRLLPRWRATAERTAAAASGGRVSVAVTGLTPVFAELHQADLRDLRRLELVTAPVVLLLLVLGLRSFGAALLTAATAGTCALLSAGLLSALALLWPVDSMALTVATTIGFGLGLDYALLLVLRHRDLVREGAGHREAAAAARTSAGRAMLWCAGAVVVTSAILYVVPSQLVRTMGLAAGLTALVTATTVWMVLPLLLARLGPRLRRHGRTPSRRQPTKAAVDDGQACARPDCWERWAAHLMRHPWPWLAAALAVLALAIAPVGGLLLTTHLDRAAITHSAAGTGLAQLERNGLANTTLLALPHRAGQGPVDTRALTAALQDDARVTAVSTLDNGRDLTLAVVSDRVPVDAAGSARLVDDVRSTAARTLPPGQPVHAAGPAAAMADFHATLRAALWQVAGFCAAGALLLMFVAFRSLLIPVKALLMNALATAAAFGLLARYADLTGDDVNVLVPVLALTIVFGLSLDYEVFLVHRITAYYRAGGDHRAAVVRGLGETARPITLAAVTMAAVFAALLTTQRQDLRHLGFLVAAAVLVDATLIRMVLVPTLMRLFGHLNWWLPPAPRRAFPRAAAPSSAPGTEGLEPGGTATGAGPPAPLIRRTPRIRRIPSIRRTPSEVISMDHTADTFDVMRAVLTSAFRVPEDEVVPDATLEQLDLDSLALAEFALILEERLGVKIDSEHAVRSTTLAEVATHLDELRSAAVAP
ncbi:MMPL family transporter [Streptomyces huasconensis]|uniref:MMPL family transporter n=1 Tax=Streptomyces huasconensis TaxID=1854574 RepID=UPI0033DEACDC